EELRPEVLPDVSE
uniref:Pedin n=2 Tax=Hydra vulgaris TaxID=6087 RepID=PEDI_HYDVU|nr:RecName: Full=Pedin [Hydra vulgaris]